MFGTLKPHHCALGHDGRIEYSRFYCGLCKSLGDGYGTLSRALVGHDAVFVALVADGLLDEGAAPDRCRCPILPVVHRPTVRPDSVAMRYAAAIQMMLGDQWLADRAIEGKTLARMARPLARGYVAEAKETLSALGVSLDALDGFERRQARCEVIGETGPETAARPTAEALGHVFATIAALPGAGEALASEGTRRDLMDLGRALGGVIYWADALEDARKDCLSGEFNPCTVRDPATQALTISSARVTRCVRLLDAALAEIRRIVGRLPWQRHQEVVTHILCGELPAAARRVAAQARAWAEEDAPRAAARAMVLARLSWTARAFRRAAVVAMVLWSWLIGLRSVLAQDGGRKTPSVPPRAAQDAGADADAGDAGDADAEAGVAGDGFDWQWPDLTDPDNTAPGGSAAPGASGVPNTGPAAPGEQPGTGAPPGRENPGAPADQPGGGGLPKCPGGKDCCCCDQCSNWCGQTCGECFKPCGQCGDCGKGCGDCGKCCEGGDCCKGCGDCGGCGNCKC